MEYIVKEVKNSSLVVEFKDGSWAEVPVANGMTLGEVDETVLSFAPKGVVNDTTLTSLVGQTRTAQVAPAPVQEEEPEVEPWEDDWPDVDQEAMEEELIQKIVVRVLDAINSN